MYRKLFVLAFIASMFAMYSVVHADVFIDNFDVPHDYLTEGVAGTGWDGFLGPDQGATNDKLNVSMDRPGQLYIEATGGYWDSPWEPLGPYFYKKVDGDFSVTVRVTDFAGTYEAPLLHNAAGLMVRNPDSDTEEENWVSIAYFPTWTAFIAWSTTNDARIELGQTAGIWNGVDTYAIAEQYPYIQIERIGSEFHPRISSDGINFIPLTDPAYLGIYDGSQTPLVINRPDLPSTLQIGLFQATYSAETGYVAFDEFSIEGPDVVSADKASLPAPSNRATDISRDVIFSWMPGVNADSHNVYFGTDPNDVTEANPSDPRGVLVSPNQTALTYSPGLLDYDTIYYWRVDEVSNAAPDNPSMGNVWSFTTANFIVLDDFEDYTDFSPNEVWNTWIDGFGDATNGSTAGYPDPDFNAGGHYVETSIRHGGKQSMPVFYDNSSARLSEVTRSIADVRNWTVDDIVTLTLFYYGDAGNAVVPMYVALNGTASIANEDPRAVLDADWVQWDILLQDFADKGINLTSVNSITIGFGDKDNPVVGGAGHVFIDDIRLSRSLPADTEPEPESVDPGTANLAASYSFENNTQDTSGHGLNATLNGGQYVQGPTGYGNAVSLDGANDYVTLPIGSAIGSMTDGSVALWVNFSGGDGSWQRIFDFGSGETVYMFLTPSVGTTGQMRFAIRNDDNAESILDAPTRLATGWHHVAVVIDSSMAMKLYLDGKSVATGTSQILPMDMGQTTQNWLGKSQFVSDAFYEGSIDEVKIYNKALSPLEVLYLAGK